MKLKPCPFCGGEATPKLAPYIGGGGCGYIVDCDECWSRTGYYSQKAEAIASWNTRAELGSGTCEPVGEWVSISQSQKVRHASCSECGYEFGMEEKRTIPFEMLMPVELPNFCPNCGARVEVAR